MAIVFNWWIFVWTGPFFLHRTLKSGITLPAEIKVPFKISKSIKNFHVKIFFTLIINFVVVFLAYYPNVFLFLPPKSSGYLSEVWIHVLLWVRFFPIWQAWQLLFCGKFSHLKLPPVLCCGSAADSVEWKRRQSASQNKQKAGIIACAAASTEKMKKVFAIQWHGCGL